MGDEERWAAVVARDGAADGGFVFAVTTTGVFCRPSCAARRPRRAHVRFFADAAAAGAAGFRPCLRCRPGAVDAERALVAAACRRILAADAPPPLAVLAGEAELPPQRFARLFRRATGLSPRAFARAERARRARAALDADGARVTDAIIDAGFNSTGRFYADAPATFGMRPAAYRRGEAGEMVRFALADTTLGTLLVAASARGVCRVALGDDPDALLRDLQARWARTALAGDDAAFGHLVATVATLVEHPDGAATLPLDLRGTAFQHRVWDALRRIPPGTTATYAAIAAAIGAPGAVRAVGAACGANPVALLVPCHRVVRGDGTPSGYAWGLARKAALIERENRARAAPTR